MINLPHRSNLSLEDTLTSVAKQFAVCLLVLIFFIWVRRFFPRLYYPLSDKMEDKAHLKANSMLSWICPLLKQDIDKDIIPDAGYDAGIILIFVQWCRNVMLFIATPMAAILIPANFMSNPERIGKDNFLIQWLSLQYKRDWTIWMNVGACWLFTILVLYSLKRLNRRVFRLRQLYFSSTAYTSSPSSHTVMLSSIPPRLQGYGRMQSYLEQCGLTTTDYVLHFVGTLRPLNKLIHSHRAKVLKAEKVLAKLCSHRPDLGAPTNIPWGVDSMVQHHAGGASTPSVPSILGISEVETLTSLYADISFLEERIRIMQTELQSPLTPTTSSLAFLAFPSIAHAHSSLAAMQRYHRKHIFSFRSFPRVRISPSPEEILWSNASQASGSVFFRSILTRLVAASIAILGLYLIFLIPMVITFDTIFPGRTKDIIVGGNKDRDLSVNVDTLLILLLHTCLPLITRKLAALSGVISKRERDIRSMEFITAFFLINALFILVVDVATTFDSNAPKAVASAALHADQHSTADDSALLSVRLSVGLLETSLFWLSYAFIQGLIQFVTLLELPYLLKHLLFRALPFLKNRIKTPREERQASSQSLVGYMCISHHYASLLFLLMICTIYTVISPLIAPIAAVAFALLAVILRYKIVHQQAKRHETGGEIWPMIIMCIHLGLGLAPLGIALVIGLREAHPWAAIALQPIFIYSVISGYRFYLHPAEGFQYSQETSEKDEETLVDGRKSQTSSVINPFFPPMLSMTPPLIMVSVAQEPIVRRVWMGPYEVIDEEIEK